jgi:ribosomal protein L16 Arg81 hydroxylase
LKRANTRVPAAKAAGALARLLQPIAVDEFLSTAWEKRPLLVSRGQADYFADLFGIADFDRLLAVSRLGTNTVRLLKDGREVPALVDLRQNHAAVEAACQQFAAGATLSFQSVHERFEPVSAFCRELSRACSVEFQANAYLTPPNSQGLGLHHDTHDVFVVQTLGSKRWRIHGAPAVTLPTRAQRFNRHTMRPGAVLIDTTLRAGDTLYVPRGFVHEAASTKEASLHLTLGVHAVQLGTLLSTHLSNLIATSPAMRRSLPPGFAGSAAARRRAQRMVREALDEFRRSADPEDLVDAAAFSVSTSAAAPLAGRLLAAEASFHVRPSTAVRVRPHAVIARSNGRRHVTLTFQGRLVRFPSRAAAAVDHILAASSCTARTLPGPLDLAGNLLLIRTLLAEGFCELDS